MKNYRFVLSFVLCLLAMCLSAQSVSKEVAEQRKANISNVVYDLTFNVPADVKTPVSGKAVISFDLQNKQEVQNKQKAQSKHKVQNKVFKTKLMH